MRGYTEMAGGARVSWTCVDMAPKKKKRFGKGAFSPPKMAGLFESACSAVWLVLCTLRRNSVPLSL